MITNSLWFYMVGGGGLEPYKYIIVPEAEANYFFFSYTKSYKNTLKRVIWRKSSWPPLHREHAHNCANSRYNMYIKMYIYIKEKQKNIRYDFGNIILYWKLKDISMYIQVVFKSCYKIYTMLWKLQQS